MDKSLEVRTMVEEIEESHVSKIWILLPLFLGFIGGILGYLLIKDDDKELAKNLFIFGCFWTFVLVVAWIIIFQRVLH
jgi:hypothetical protein